MLKCPVCEDSRLREVEKNEILIDICPSCKGVWLDRGELDKLMSGVREERDDYNEWHNREDRYKSSVHKDDSDRYKYDHESNPYRKDYPRKKKKKSVMDMFGDLFD